NAIGNLFAGRRKTTSFDIKKSTEGTEAELGLDEQPRTNPLSGLSAKRSHTSSESISGEEPPVHFESVFTPDRAADKTAEQVEPTNAMSFK
ncbi:MAG: hypothetical protein M1486_05535, partial [Gammaproteobacteria bacterium]|nr:hypothetical protein [Gammaproteobacteria bacterium]